MIYSVFSVHDVKAKCWTPPYFAQNAATGVRMFAASVNEPNSMAAKFPEDFHLYEIATFDDENGTLMMMDYIPHGTGAHYRD